MRLVVGLSRGMWAVNIFDVWSIKVVTIFGFRFIYTGYFLNKGFSNFAARNPFNYQSDSQNKFSIKIYFYEHNPAIQL